MDNEKYGIEIELITDSFNKQAEKIKKEAKSIQKAFDPSDISALKINGKPWQEYGNEAEKATKKIERRIVSLNDGFSKIGYNVNIQPFLDAAASQEKLAENTEKAAQKQVKLKNEVKNTNTELSKTNKSKGFSSITKGLDGMTSKIKRFGLALLSVRSIWSLVSRASSAYLSQDTALANKLQSAWAGLGAMLAPIIERIVDLIAKAVKYINIFIKALTGVDLLARATAKSMNGTAKSAKALNKALAGFDELQNLDTDAGGGADIGGGLSGLEDVEINTEWADKITAFGKWIRKNKEPIISALLGVAGAILAIKVGVVAIKALGIGVAIAGLVYAIQGLIKYLKDPSFKNFGQIIQGIGIAVIGLGIAFLGLPGIVAGVVVLIVGTIIKYWDKIKEFLQNGINWLADKSDFIHEKFGDTIGWIYDTFVENLQRILDWFDLLFTTIKGIFDGIIKVIKGVFTGEWELAWEGVKQIFVNIWNFIKNTFLMFVDWIWKNTIQPVINLFLKLKDRLVELFRNIGIAVGNVIGSAFKGVINGILRAIENILNSPIRAINNLIGIVNAIPGINLRRLSTFSLPRLDVGTNYVPEDQIAMIHKGEAVVPKKFNSKEYFGNNDETNALLQELIEKVDKIEINPYTTIKDVGKASLSYINSKSRQLGESVVV